MSGNITQTSALDMYVFGKTNDGNSVVGPSKMKLYSFKIYESGTLVKNFVPCYRVSDNELGLYVIGNSSVGNNYTYRFQFDLLIDADYSE